MAYDISDKGLKALAFFEGLRREAYKDVAGYLTIGVGHLLTPAEKESGIITSTGATWRDGLTEQECLDLLRIDVQSAVKAVNAALSKLRLFQHEFDALVSFTFNIGAGAFNHSTMHDMLAEGNYRGAPNEFHKWVKAGGKTIQGLVNRRKAEQALFEKGEYPK